MAKNTRKESGDLILKFFGGSALVVVPLMFVFNSVLERMFGSGAMDVRGQFGDQFGALNALFSGLAFLGLILTLAYQSRDLNAQTRSLELQQEAFRQQIAEFQEQKEEMRRSAAAQEKANRLQELGFKVEVQKLKAELYLNAMHQSVGPESPRSHFHKAKGISDELEEIVDEALGEIRSF